MFIAFQTQSASPTKWIFTQHSLKRFNIQVPESVSERSPQLAMNAVVYDAMPSPRYCSGELRNPPSLVCFEVTSISLLFSTLCSSSSPNNEPYLNTQSIHPSVQICNDRLSTFHTKLNPLSATSDLDTSRPSPTPNYHQRHQGLMQSPNRVLGNCKGWSLKATKGEREREVRGRGRRRHIPRPPDTFSDLWSW